MSVAQRREGEDMKQDGVHAATPASVRGDVWKVVEDRAEPAVWEVLDQYPESVMSDAQYANIIKHVAGHLATVLSEETGMDSWCTYEFDPNPTFSDKTEIAKGVYVERMEREDEIFCRIEGKEGILLVKLYIYGHIISSSKYPHIDYMLIHDFEIHPDLIL